MSGPLKTFSLFCNNLRSNEMDYLQPCVFVGFGMIRLRKLFLFLEFLGVSDSQPILFVFGLSGLFQCL